MYVTGVVASVLYVGSYGSLRIEVCNFHIVCLIVEGMEEGLRVMRFKSSIFFQRVVFFKMYQKGIEIGRHTNKFGENLHFSKLRLQNIYELIISN